MKKELKYLAVSEKIPIFANANLEKMGDNAHFDILHDRQTRADLIESGKFAVTVNSPQKVALESSPACPVSFRRTRTALLYLCYRYTRTLSGEYVREACPFSVTDNNN
jgi:hypothetical protein